jgi:hypothetical protein
LSQQLRVKEDEKGRFKTVVLIVLKKNHTRSIIIEKMEMLSVWIDDMGQRHVPVSPMTIQNKALNLCNFLKNQQEEEIQRKFRGFLWMV